LAFPSFYVIFVVKGEDDMDYQDALNYLNSFINYEKKKDITYDESHYNLEAFRELAEEFGSPFNAYPSIHVTGTKGKGSVVEFLKNMLMVQGYRVGTFTSPHLFNTRERIRIDDAWISEESFASLMETIRPATADREKRYRTFFELMTLMSFLYFQRENVDWAIFEVGMGGRLDSTNIISPRCAVINTLGLDHTETLGPTLQHIAREKAGIVKKGIPVIIGPQKDEIRDYLVQLTIDAGGIPVVYGNDFTVAEDEIYLGKEKIGFVHLALEGEHQLKNCACALQALKSAGMWKNKKSMIGAAEKTTVGGRIEIRPFEGRFLVLDVGHTLESVDSLYRVVDKKFPGKRIVSVISYSHGKNISGMVALDKKYAQELIFTENSSFRGAKTEELAAACGPGKSISVKDLKEALNKALELSEEGDVIVIHGSFYLMGDIYEILEKY
jgi:dihydrofolate synthase/folylpolyglutamate synthase